jgi:predicted PurR-regulated permease PerM
MAARSLGEELARDLTVKAVIWVPSIVGVMLFGPVGLLLGPAAWVALVASGSDNSPQPPADDQGAK